ncbi:hypothetical protein GCM10020221_35350 [Streptomyces thioluteus]|uniref:Uncharacterized protein n=1 Tax=Streptomyces thioluteus TaxID=66431 RepID=A0ABN3X3L1_STRTU
MVVGSVPGASVSGVMAPWSVEVRAQAGAGVSAGEGGSVAGVRPVRGVAPAPAAAAAAWRREVRVRVGQGREVRGWGHAAAVPERGVVGRVALEQGVAVRVARGQEVAVRVAPEQEVLEQEVLEGVAPVQEVPVGAARGERAGREAGGVEQGVREERRVAGRAEPAEPVGVAGASAGGAWGSGSTTPRQRIPHGARDRGRRCRGRRRTTAGFPR